MFVRDTMDISPALHGTLRIRWSRYFGSVIRRVSLLNRV